MLQTKNKSDGEPRELNFYIFLFLFYEYLSPWAKLKPGTDMEPRM